MHAAGVGHRELRLLYKLPQDPGEAGLNAAPLALYVRRVDTLYWLCIQVCLQNADSVADALFFDFGLPNTYEPAKPLWDLLGYEERQRFFQRINEPYKGNVLFVDFWEMSCGPCRGKMLSMRDEVEANKDKPVKYLYVTDDTPEHCKSFLEPNNIKGEHIHITRAEWGYLQEKFQFSAIPFVVILDKNGKQRKDVMVEQLLNE